MLDFNDMSTLVGHVVLSPREKAKREEEIKETGKKEEKEK